jgi:hypothetical protein
MHGDGQDAATKVPPDLAAALALGDYERAAAVECSTALRVEAAIAERASGRREPVFASRAITSMAIALGRRGQMEDAIAMLNAEARLAKELSEHLAGQGCNPSERAVLEKCLVRAEREDSYILCRETVRNELFDLFGIWIGSGPHARLPARAPASQPASPPALSVCLLVGGSVPAGRLWACLRLSTLTRRCAMAHTGSAQHVREGLENELMREGRKKRKTTSTAVMRDADAPAAPTVSAAASAEADRRERLLNELKRVERVLQREARSILTHTLWGESCQISLPGQDPHPDGICVRFRGEEVFNGADCPTPVRKSFTELLKKLQKRNFHELSGRQPVCDRYATLITGTHFHHWSAKHARQLACQGGGGGQGGRPGASALADPRDASHKLQGQIALAPSAYGRTAGAGHERQSSGQEKYVSWAACNTADHRALVRSRGAVLVPIPWRPQCPKRTAETSLHAQMSLPLHQVPWKPRCCE